MWGWQRGPESSGAISRQGLDGPGGQATSHMMLEMQRGDAGSGFSFLFPARGSPAGDAICPRLPSAHGDGDGDRDSSATKSHQDRACPVHRVLPRLAPLPPSPCFPTGAEHFGQPFLCSSLQSSLSSPYCLLPVPQLVSILLGRGGASRAPGPWVPCKPAEVTAAAQLKTPRKSCRELVLVPSWAWRCLGSPSSMGRGSTRDKKRV